MIEDDDEIPALHLRKLCVGCQKLEELSAWQTHQRKQGLTIGHTTMNWPRRRSEILPGGSIYWIVKGRYAARQRILRFEEAKVDIDCNPFAEENKPKRPFCRIVLDPVLVPVVPYPHRAFQGWRYLTTADAPPDKTASTMREYEALPDDLAQILDQIGVR